MVNMHLTKANIDEALEIANDVIETEVYSFDAIRVLAQVGLEALSRDEKMMDWFEDAWFVLPDGIQLSISTGDARILFNNPSVYLCTHNGTRFEFSFKGIAK